VRNDTGKLLAALSVSGPAFRVTKERIPEIGKAVMQAAAELSYELGYRPTAVELVREAVG
jgi:DNA-binding IclR family transcriptional regulator